MTAAAGERAIALELAAGTWRRRRKPQAMERRKRRGRSAVAYFSTGVTEGKLKRLPVPRDRRPFVDMAEVKRLIELRPLD